MAPEVFSITSAAPATTTDQRARQRTYLFGMAVRTACFLGAIPTPSPWRWVLIGGAVLLPYFSVIIANAGRDRSDDVAVESPHVRGLGPSASS